MPRHHTIGHPKSWVDSTDEVPGHWEDSYQEDVPFTPDEELARDEEESQWVIERASIRVAEEHLQSLHDKLAADTITDAEQREMLRLERGM